MLKVLFTSVLLVVAVLTAALLFGAYRWNVDTQALRARIDANRVPVRPRAVDFRELDRLPAPVQRYFRAVLRDGQPMVTGVRVQHSGSFNMGETADRWKPFTSDQKVVTQRPGFDWDARVAMLPGPHVHVHDAYVGGEGILRASLVGLISLVDLKGTEDIAAGELMRFLAEATWYPTALLPSQGVRWKAGDDRSASATLTDGAVSVTMGFAFNERDLIDAVRAEARGRRVGGRIVPTPWHGRFWNYQERSGMRVPLEGEVAWQLPEGRKPYWRGRITQLAYEFAS